MGKRGISKKCKTNANAKDKKKVNRNITPLLDLKLRRRIIWEWHESKVAVRGAGGASHVGIGDIVVGVVVVIGGGRARNGGARSSVTTTGIG